MPSRIEILTKCTAPHLTFSSPPSSTTRGEAAHKKSARPTHDNATTAHAHHHPPFPLFPFPSCARARAMCHVSCLRRSHQSAGQHGLNCQTRIIDRVPGRTTTTTPPVLTLPHQHRTGTQHAPPPPQLVDKCSAQAHASINESDAGTQALYRHSNSPDPARQVRS